MSGETTQKVSDLIGTSTININNTDLQSAVAGLINKSLEAAEVTGEFLSEQTPDFINQMLLWYGVESFLCFILGLMLSTHLLIFKKWHHETRKKLEAMTDDGILLPLWVIFVCFMSTLIGLILLVNNFTWLKIWLAPKLFLVEYAATLIK